MGRDKQDRLAGRGIVYKGGGRVGGEGMAT